MDETSKKGDRFDTVDLSPVSLFDDYIDSYGRGISPIGSLIFLGGFVAILYLIARW